MTTGSLSRGVQRTVGVIGCGLIGRPVIRALARGQLGGWKLGPVLAREARTVDGVDVLDTPGDFFGHELDLIIEVAGPAALVSLGSEALATAEVWSVSGTALTDVNLRAELERIGAQVGHRLRLLPGAISGLDGVATMSEAHDASVSAIVDLVPNGETTEVVFTGTASEAASRFPHHLNVVVATALAGLGLERTAVTVRQPAAGQPHTLTIEASSRDGRVTATTWPKVSPEDGIHIVTSALLSALRRENDVIWVG